MQQRLLTKGIAQVQVCLNFIRSSQYPYSNVEYQHLIHQFSNKVINKLLSKSQLTTMSPRYVSYITKIILLLVMSLSGQIPHSAYNSTTER